MRLYSTKNRNEFTGLKEAVLRGLPPDNGLYMPESIPALPTSFIRNLKDYSFQEIAFTVTKTLFQGAIPDADLRNITDTAINFEAPLVALNERQHILELFHGPSLAFKDFGARFMAQLMSYFNQGASQELVILVATSGDTGGAVAAGFYQTPGTRVVILYPKGKVSDLQEKQLTTLGHNISALEIEGTFDDCQAMVKQAFLDPVLTGRIRLTSANSINISRLVPQSFYYFEAFKQLSDTDEVVFCVPSGNFGNLTAGLLAQRMGLPVQHFIAATNINKVVPEYLQTGNYSPRPSERTLSNAMDVGNPSNFARMQDLYHDLEERSTWNNMKASISGYAYTDEATRAAVKEVHDRYGYIIDPHGAVGYLALQEYQKSHAGANGVILETAHPAKFLPDVEAILEQKIKVPERLAKLAKREKVADLMPPEFAPFKDWLLKHLG
ncbi:MAG: threonine synthase [Phaeodactylibacter sp.]|uniref:threonine synthase n=1 Tax=Phaeodactylibacter sp. TaxID=1940289 RepID=UPI0032F01F39